MTHQDEILEMAKKAGMIWMSGLNGSGYHINHPKTIEAFAKLVDAKATEREREACAKICEDQQIRSAEASKKAKRVTDSKLYHHCSVTAGWNAAAIRARGEPTSRGETI